MKILPPITLLFALTFAVILAQPALARTLEIGEQAPPFELEGVDGKVYTLDDFANAEILTVIFSTNHCPTSQAYEERIMNLVTDYEDKGVAVVVIQPNDPHALRLDELGHTDVGDSFEDMKIRASDRNFNFPYLNDGDTQTVSRAYGPVATPHVFIFDSERRLRYQGRIDNDQNPAGVRTHDTRNALDAMLAGNRPETETTNVFGCSIKWADLRPRVEAAHERLNREQAAISEIDAEGVRSLVANDSNRTRLIKVWATWCGPCITELPDFVDIHRRYRNRNRLEVVTISMDDLSRKDRALELLNDRNASMTNFIFSGSDHDDLVAALDAEWRGPVPYTLIVAPGGEVIYRHSGPIDPIDVRRVIADTIGRTWFD